MKKQIICLLLAGSILTLAACGGNKTGEEVGDPVVQGRYIETDVTPSGAGRFTSFLSSDGTIVCFDEGLKTRYESADGGASWSETPGPGSGADRYQDIQAGAPLDDGRLLVYIMEEGLMLVSPDGGSEPYPVGDIDKAIEDGESVSISLLQSLGNDRFLLSFSSGGMIMQTDRATPPGGDASEDENGGVDEATGNERTAEPPSGAPITGRRIQGGPQGGGPRGSTNTMIGGAMSNKTLLIELSTGKVVAELPVEYVAAAASDDDSLYLMDMSGNVTIYGLGDGMYAGKPDISFGGGQSGTMGAFPMRLGPAGGGVLTLDNKGNLYAAQNRSLMMADSTGVISTVLESTAYSIGAPRDTISSVFALPDGSIVVSMLSSGQESRMYRYVWDDNATVDPNKTLSIWSLEDNNFVRAAIAELRKKHSDASISYEVATGGDNAVSAADAIKTLNTRLINGSGPDIILLDGCPADSYADKGMLLDIGELIDTGDIYDNLLAPYITEGGLYYLPTQFLMPALMGGTEALSKIQTLDDLVSLAVNGNGPPAEGGAGGGFMLGGIPEGERPELYFNDLRELCEILWLSSAPAIVSDNKLDTDALRTYLEAAKAISDKYGLGETRDGPRAGLAISVFDGGTATELSGSLVRYTSQMANYGAATLGNLQLLQIMMQREGSELRLFPGLTPGAWEPSAIAGLSADTKVPEFAAEFFGAMLSLEIQRLSYGTGLSVTRSGIAAQIDDMNERLVENGMDPFDVDIGALIGQLAVPSMGDTALTDMMWVTVEKCCKGELDVEGAVKEIEQNVKNYLAERD